MGSISAIPEYLDNGLPCAQSRYIPLSRGDVGYSWASHVVDGPRTVASPKGKNEGTPAPDSGGRGEFDPFERDEAIETRDNRRDTAPLFWDISEGSEAKKEYLAIRDPLL